MLLRCESGHRPHLLEALGVQRTIASLGEKGLSLISISLSYTHTHTHTHHLTHALNVARGAAEAWPKQKHVVLNRMQTSAHTPHANNACSAAHRERCW
jgi:hypothetical protein